MNENDPHRDSDPLWYDRAEPDEAPGPVLGAFATLYGLAAVGCATALRIYGLPDRLWLATARRLARSGVTGAGRS